MDINVSIAEQSVYDFNDITGLDYENNLFKYNGEMINLFPAPQTENLRAMDQIILQGHYLYYLNNNFRRSYIESFGHEMSIKFRDMRDLFLENIFYTLYYGIVVAKYISKMPETPLEYMQRPIANENNPDKSAFLSAEYKINPKYRFDCNGSPFCHYMKKKSLVIVPNEYSGLSSQTVICPIKGIIPTMKDCMVNFSRFAEVLLGNISRTGMEEDKKFISIFTDSSWNGFKPN